MAAFIVWNHLHWVSVELRQPRAIFVQSRFWCFVGLLRWDFADKFWFLEHFFSVLGVCVVTVFKLNLICFLAVEFVFNFFPLLIRIVGFDFQSIWLGTCIFLFSVACGSVLTLEHFVILVAFCWGCKVLNGIQAFRSDPQLGTRNCSVLEFFWLACSGNC